MTIEPVSPEIISLENFEPTALADLFIHPATREAVFVQGEAAYRITTTE
jgi:hypothetical protein